MHLLLPTLAITTSTLLLLSSPLHVSAGSVDLTSTSFTTHIKEQGRPAIVKFYAPWCGHCKRLAPDWEKLGDAFPLADTDGVVIGSVDCTVHNGLCSEYGVTGYPTLMYFNDETGHKGAAYNKGRTLADLSSFVEQQLQPKCNPTGTNLEGCTEKEKEFIGKFTKLGKAGVETELKRLEGLKGGSMTPELKKWLFTRIMLLKKVVAKMD